MKVLVDECLPFWLARHLAGHDVKTVQQMGWSSLKDGEILNQAESKFEVFLTADKNLKHQQSLAGRKLAIILAFQQAGHCQGLAPCGADHVAEPSAWNAGAVR